MEAYLQHLKAAYDTGTLLMDVILPTAYDYLEATGAVGRLHWMDFWDAAVQYRIEQAQSPIGNRKLSILISQGEQPTLREREQLERRRKEDIARKLAVYHYLGDTKRLSEQTKNQ